MTKVISFEEQSFENKEKNLDKINLENDVINRNSLNIFYYVIKNDDINLSNFCKLVEENNCNYYIIDPNLTKKEIIDLIFEKYSKLFYFTTKSFEQFNEYMSNGIKLFYFRLDKKNTDSNNTISILNNEKKVIQLFLNKIYLNTEKKYKIIISLGEIVFSKYSNLINLLISEIVYYNSILSHKENIEYLFSIDSNYKLIINDNFKLISMLEKHNINQKNISFRFQFSNNELKNYIESEIDNPIKTIYNKKFCNFEV